MMRARKTNRDPTRIHHRHGRITIPAGSEHAPGGTCPKATERRNGRLLAGDVRRSPAARRRGAALERLPGLR
jgi:hypothetical protein